MVLRRNGPLGAVHRSGDAGILRFVAGLGLGGVVPTAIALTAEYSPPNRRQLNNALMYSGYFIGGILTALIGMLLLPQVDFRVMFAIGMLPLLLVLPVAWRYLPESVAYLSAKGRHEEARALADRYGLAVADVTIAPSDVDGTDQWAGIRTLFSRHYIAATFLFAVASFCGLLIVYGLNTWLPNIMRTAGYGLNSSLAFLLALNVGGIAGTILAGRVADRIGIKLVTACSFAVATAAILLLSTALPVALVFLAVLVAGAGTGTQILLNGFVATHYPDASRATALGWSLGIGRVGAILGPVIGGLVAASTLGFQWNFYLFAGFALLGAVLVAAVPRALAAADPTPAAREAGPG